MLGHDDRGFATLEAKLVLDSAISRLSDRERLILRWRFEDERAQQEIADFVGLTQAQVSPEPHPDPGPAAHGPLGAPDRCLSRRSCMHA